jgi:hypothetical protein
MGDAATCAKCGCDVPADGACPRCALAAALPAADAGPTAEEVAAKLPAFEILGVLGRGGMGVVFKARQKALDRIVALKVLPPATAQTPGFADRFQREAKAMARLAHPNIVAVYEFGDSGGLFYLVLEFVDGVNVREAMAAGRIRPGDALTIVPQICDALQYAHDRGVVHRDIKPENVLIGRDGRVKIADFGLAKLADRETGDPSLTGAGQVMGTLRYMAPEQWERPKEVDHRADIYSLGVVFYEMLTGELPMGKFEPPSAKARIDVRIDDVVMRAIERDRERRWQRVDDVSTHISAITSGGAAVATAASAAPAAEKSARADQRLAKQARERQALDAVAEEARAERRLLPFWAGLVMFIVLGFGSSALSSAGNSKGAHWCINADAAILALLIAGGIVAGKRWGDLGSRLRPAKMRWLPVGSFVVVAFACVAVAVALLRGMDQGPFGEACGGAYLLTALLLSYLCISRRDAVRDAEAGKRGPVGPPVAVEIVAWILFAAAASGVGDARFAEAWLTTEPWQEFEATVAPGQHERRVENWLRRDMWDRWSRVQALQDHEWNGDVENLYEPSDRAKLGRMSADERAKSGADGALGVPLLSRQVLPLANFKIRRAEFGGLDDGKGPMTAVVEATRGAKTLRFSMRWLIEPGNSGWRFTASPVEIE